MRGSSLSSFTILVSLIPLAGANGIALGFLLYWGNMPGVFASAAACLVMGKYADHLARVTNDRIDRGV